MKRYLGAIVLVSLAIPLSRLPLDIPNWSAPPGLLAQYIFVGFNKGASAAAPTISHTCTAGGFVTGTTSTCSAFSGNVTSGHYVAVFLFWNVTNTLSSVTAPCVTGNFTIYNQTSDTYVSAWAVGVASSTGSCAPTATFSATSMQVQMLGFDIAGSSGRDVSGMTANTSTGASPSSPSVTTNAANELVIGAVQDTGGNANGFTVGSGYASVVSGPDASYTNLSEKQTQTVAGAVAATFSASNGTVTWVAGIITFKP